MGGSAVPDEKRQIKSLYILIKRSDIFAPKDFSRYLGKLSHKADGCQCVHKRKGMLVGEHQRHDRKTNAYHVFAALWTELKFTEQARFSDWSIEKCLRSG